MTRAGNLGATRLRRRRRRLDPMQVYDRLPPDLRAWMAEAALPWSPLSCLRLWQRALQEEGCPARARTRLDRAEAALLAREHARLQAGRGVARRGPSRGGQGAFRDDTL
jgi:hypothetical protein